jgi:hypothetical protein
MEGPFSTLESAHEYITLLFEQVVEVRQSVDMDVADAMSNGGGRRLDALRLVDFKLSQLEHHLGSSRRTLRDLKALRRILLKGPDAVEETDLVAPRALELV